MDKLILLGLQTSMDYATLGASSKLAAILVTYPIQVINVMVKLLYIFITFLSSSIGTYCSTCNCFSFGMMAFQVIRARLQVNELHLYIFLFRLLLLFPTDY